MTGPAVGIVCGMKSEARAVRGASERFAVRVSGADVGRAGEAAQALADAGAAALVSFGLSGALDPSAAPGRLVIPIRTILPDGNSVASDAELFARLTAHAESLAHPHFGPAPLTAAIAGTDSIISTAADKAVLRARTGAVAVDMESHAVARAAKQAGLPFVAIRAIADPSDRAIPPAAMAGIAPDGTIRLIAVIGKLMIRPQDGPILMRLGRDSAAGLSSLRRAARHLLPVL